MGRHMKARHRLSMNMHQLVVAIINIVIVVAQNLMIINMKNVNIVDEKS
jgi:heme/copper-type cytochrome/quinol oxidase subunit 4